VRVLSIRDVLVVDDVGGHSLGLPTTRHEIHEGGLELSREAVHKVLGSLGEDLHLALMTLGLAVALEAIGIATLLLAHLTVPS